MCGRFAVQTSKDQLIEAFMAAMPDLEIEDIPDFFPRYNVAPSQRILTIGRSEGRPHPKFAFLQWGLVPHFVKDTKGSPAPINVRSESAAEKPMFRQAFAKRRCLVIADAFYEWKREGSAKQPYCIRMKNKRPFAFAGIYEVWRGEGGAAPLVSCAIFTTIANDVLRPIHNRMPVILDPEQYATWCDPEMRDAVKLQPWLKPYADDALTAYAVSTRVNSPRNDDPECLEPLQAA